MHLFFVGIVLTLMATWGAPVLVEWLFFPSMPFAKENAPPAPNYSDPASWVASPVHHETLDRVSWVPEEIGETNRQNEARFDTFFVHPTSYFIGHWNAPMDSFSANEFTNRQTAELAMVFNGESRVFMPRYRQLSQGAQDRYPVAEHQPAMDVAFADVWDAFLHFLAHSQGRPFFIGSHSQGTLHAARLLQRWLASAPPEEKSRLVAAYLIGNTVTENDMADVLPVCAQPNSTFCYLSYNTVQHGDESQAAHWRNKGPPTCVNPISWKHDELVASKNLHRGAIPMLTSQPILSRILLYPILRYISFIKPDTNLVSAQCKNGILFVSDPLLDPSAGCNYGSGGFHAWDVHLFWMDLRANIHERASSFVA